MYLSHANKLKRQEVERMEKEFGIDGEWDSRKDGIGATHHTPQNAFTRCWLAPGAPTASRGPSRSNDDAGSGPVDEVRRQRRRAAGGDEEEEEDWDGLLG